MFANHAYTLPGVKQPPVWFGAGRKDVLQEVEEFFACQRRWEANTTARLARKNTFCQRRLITRRQNLSVLFEIVLEPSDNVEFRGSWKHGAPLEAELRMEQAPCPDASPNPGQRKDFDRESDEPCGGGNLSTASAAKEAPGLSGLDETSSGDISEKTTEFQVSEQDPVQLVGLPGCATFVSAVGCEHGQASRTALLRSTTVFEARQEWEIATPRVLFPEMSEMENSGLHEDRRSSICTFPSNKSTISTATVQQSHSVVLKRKRQEKVSGKGKRLATQDRSLISYQQRSLAAGGVQVSAAPNCEDGRRRSTRFKTRPLEHWRNEKLLYANLGSGLPTVIGIKFASPPSLWETRGKRQKWNVVSFVSPSHQDLVKFAAL